MLKAIYVKAGSQDVLEYPYIEFSIADDTLTFTNVDSTGNELSNVTITTETINEKEQVLAVYEGYFGELFIQDWDATSLAASNMTLKIGTSPRVMLYSDGTDYIVIGCYPLKTSEQTTVIDNVSVKLSEMVKPAFGSDFKMESFNIRAAKRELIASLDYSVSLAYLEAQVDLLSEMLFAVVDAHTEIAAAIDHYSDIKNAVTSSSLLNIKTVEKCLAEIMTNKANLRTLQSEYYAAKKENGAS